ncbi:MAG TPA: hypothetical protein VFN77_06355 [Acetobacteraceae bacterium]|nr:hypothetical protein [Acetobacteraceae bacterium]
MSQEPLPPVKEPPQVPKPPVKQPPPEPDQSPPPWKGPERILN